MFIIFSAKIFSKKVMHRNCYLVARISCVPIILHHIKNLQNMLLCFAYIEFVTI